MKLPKPSHIKLHAYSFDKSSLKFLFSYLNNRWNRPKTNQKFSSWEELLQEVPQGPVLGPLLFNIYLNDLFYLTESTEVCNFADDTTFFAGAEDLNSLIKRLEHDRVLAIEWFQNNMKLNQDKCHLLVFCYKHENVWAQIGDEIIWGSNGQTLLGLQIDRNLNFNEYVSSLCKKAGKKLSVLPRLSNFMNIKQRRVLMKSFTESQFGCCPLIWMLHGKGVNNKIIHLHESSLRIVYKDDKSSFKELLQKDNSFTGHHRNIKLLAIELFKVTENLSNTIINDILQTRTLPYNLRSQTDFARSFVNTSRFSLNSLTYFASKVWNIVPSDIKNASNLHIFKNKEIGT